MFLQILFVIFMGIVAILLINMLIAMMGNTYQKIAETRNEWQRQVTLKKIHQIMNLIKYINQNFKNYVHLKIFNIPSKKMSS